MSELIFCKDCGSKIHIRIDHRSDTLHIIDADILMERITGVLSSITKSSLEDKAGFANYGYENSSTNRIVKSCEISKGSLFKYFHNKEDLYFFILDTVTTDFTESLEKNTHNLAIEIFQRIIEYSTLEFSWYIQNPEKAKLIIGAFTKNYTEIYKKTIERYSFKELDIYNNLTKDIELIKFRWDKQKTIDILKWCIKGFNEDFLSNVQKDIYIFEQIQDEYVNSLTEYMEITF